MNIYEKLSAIQTELKAPKSQFNKFGNYYYRNAEDILEALKPLTAKNKCVLVLSDSVEQVGLRYYLTCTATLHDCESEEKITSVAFAREEENKKGMDGSQITGASSSYARKYALNGLFNIDDTKDTDMEEDLIEKVTAEEIEEMKAPPMSNEKIDELRSQLFAKPIEWYTTPLEVKKQIEDYAKKKGIALTQEYVDKSLTAYAERGKKNQS